MPDPITLAEELASQVRSLRIALVAFTKFPHVCSETVGPRECTPCAAHYALASDCAESPASKDASTLANVRGLIQERIGAYRVLSRFAVIDQNAANACINVLGEVLDAVNASGKDDADE